MASGMFGILGNAFSKGRVPWKAISTKGFGASFKLPALVVQ